MPNIFKIGVVLFAITISLNASAQDVTALIKEGRELNSQKQYPQAIEKYKSALLVEPENVQANYQLAFTLFASGKGPDGVPYLDMVIKANTSIPLTAASYSLLGSIYSSTKQLPKAIEAYKNGIRADSANQRIYYNLGIAYFMSKLYTDAGQSFIDAIKRDSADAGSVRMYALAAFHENKRAEALLGFCRFLQLEPNSARSKEAFGNLQNILSGGSLKAEPGYKPSPYVKTHAAAQNGILAKALSGFTGRKYYSPTALLTAQLKSVFTALGTMSRDKSYFWYSYADYFSKLSPADNLPTLAKVISQSVYQDSAKWVKDNADKIGVYEVWAKGTAVL